MKRVSFYKFEIETGNCRLMVVSTDCEYSLDHVLFKSPVDAVKHANVSNLYLAYEDWSYEGVDIKYTEAKVEEVVKDVFLFVSKDYDLYALAKLRPVAYMVNDPFAELTSQARHVCIFPDGPVRDILESIDKAKRGAYESE